MEQLAPRLAIAVFLSVAAAATWHVLDNFLVITPPAGCAGPAGSPRIAECVAEFRSARRSLGVMPQQQQDVTAAMLVRVEVQVHGMMRVVRRLQASNISSFTPSQQHFIRAVSDDCLEQGADAAEEVREAYLELRAGPRGDDLRFQLAAIKTKLSNCVTGFAEFAPGVLKTELGAILAMGTAQVKSTVNAAVTIASAYRGYGTLARGQQSNRQQVAQTVGMRAGQAGAGLRRPVLYPAQQSAGLRPWQARQSGQTAQAGLRPIQAGQTGQAEQSEQAGKLGQAAQGGQVGLRPTQAGQLGQGGKAGLRPTQAGQAAQKGQAGLRPTQAGQAAQGAQVGQHLAVQYSTGLQPQTPAQPQTGYQVQAQSQQLAWSQVQPVYDYNEYEYDDPIDGGSDYPTGRDRRGGQNHFEGAEQRPKLVQAQSLYEADLSGSYDVGEKSTPTGVGKMSLGNDDEYNRDYRSSNDSESDYYSYEYQESQRANSGYDDLDNSPQGGSTFQQATADSSHLLHISWDNISEGNTDIGGDGENPDYSANYSNDANFAKDVQSSSGSVGSGSYDDVDSKTSPNEGSVLDSDGNGRSSSVSSANYRPDSPATGRNGDDSGSDYYDDATDNNGDISDGYDSGSDYYSASGGGPTDNNNGDGGLGSNVSGGGRSSVTTASDDSDPLTRGNESGDRGSDYYDDGGDNGGDAGNNGDVSDDVDGYDSGSDGDGDGSDTDIGPSEGSGLDGDATDLGDGFESTNADIDYGFGSTTYDSDTSGSDDYSGAAASGKSEEKPWEYHDSTGGATAAATNAATVAATVAAIEDGTLNNRDGDGLDYNADAANAADRADFADNADAADRADFADNADAADNADSADDAEGPDSDDQQRDFTGTRNRQLRATDDVIRQASLQGGYLSSSGDRGESADGYHSKVGEVGEEAGGYHHPEWLEAGLYEQLKELQARMRGEHARAQQWADRRRKLLGLPAETWGSDGGEGEEGERGAAEGTRRRGFGVGQWRKRKSDTWRRRGAPQRRGLEAQGLQAQGLQAQWLQAQQLQAQARPRKSLIPLSAYPLSSPRSVRPPPIPAHHSTQRAPIPLATTMGKKTAEHLPTAGHHSPGTLHHAPGTGPAHKEKQPNHWGEGKGQGGGGVTRGHHTHLWRNGRRGAHHPAGVGHHKHKWTRKRKGGGGSGGGTGGGGGGGTRGSFKADAVVGPGEKYNTVEVRGGVVRGGMVRGGEVRGGMVRGGEVRGGEVRGGEVRGGEVRGEKRAKSGALGAAPKEGRFVVFIRAGTYHESIIFRNKGLIMVGEGSDRTIITGDKSAGSGSTTYRSATIGKNQLICTAPHRTYHESIIFRNKGLIMVGEGSDKTIITGDKSAAGSGSTTYRSATIGERCIVGRGVWCRKVRHGAALEARCNKGLIMVGGGADKTIITGDKSAGSGSATYRSATMGASKVTPVFPLLPVSAPPGANKERFCALGIRFENTAGPQKTTSYGANKERANKERFCALGIRFENTAGPQNHQAVAMRASGDRSAFFECAFEANQDTLYVDAGRQYYKDCYIGGTIDFIFGDAAVVLDNPTIVVHKSSSFATITASGRESNTPTGIVIRNAKISVDSGVSEVYLGRPWKDCARTVFVDSYMPAELERDGWSTWGGDSKGSCVYYAEKGSTGPGYAASRASWVHPGIISDASQFDPEPFVDLSSWLDVAGQNPKW
ncbi:unnamed protein product [Closterium sp. NIES-65]|nr:unnamed protein product [Closterium sp. NIES-65]